MSKNGLAFVFACLLACTSINALAAKGGGTTGGMSAGHMSSAGQENTNGQASADRDKGLERADDRRSASGASHEKAQQKQSNKHKSENKNKY